MAAVTIDFIWLTVSLLEHLLIVILAVCQQNLGNLFIVSWITGLNRFLCWVGFQWIGDKILSFISF